MALVIGDVTDKGVPAALVMATTRTTLRAMATQTSDPGQVLAEPTSLSSPRSRRRCSSPVSTGSSIPATGDIVYANAGHNLPYVRTAGGVVEMRATGMPLGLMTGMNYEVAHARLNPGETVLLTSDGIVEQHDRTGDMFGFPRLIDLVAKHDGAQDLISTILAQLDLFRGDDGEQEDDVTMVTIKRTSSALESAEAFGTDLEEIASFTLDSTLGNEREAMVRVAEIAAGLGLGGERLERLKTAVSEAAMNAIEHGNKGDPDLPVLITVLADEREDPRPDPGSGRRSSHSGRRYPQPRSKACGRTKPAGMGPLSHREDGRCDENQHR